MNIVQILLLATLWSTSQSQELGVEWSCGDNGSVLVRREGLRVDDSAQGRLFEDMSLDQCSMYCVNNQDLSGNSVQCAAFVFDPVTSSCTMYSSFNDVIDDQSMQMYQKSCVKTDRVCSSPFTFEMNKQKILVGFAREVVPADSVADCFAACLNSIRDFGFECESIMYYVLDGECILNTEDRRDRPDLFIDETQDEVIYFDNNCAGSQCFAPYVTQYIQVEGMELEAQMDVQINAVSMDSCAELCTSRVGDGSPFNCKSFMYDYRTQVCTLSDERSLPTGRAALREKSGTTFYEKKCFATTLTCRNTPAFNRVPQMILVGFAAFVMENVPSVTQCLDLCIAPPEETGDDFECMSVMYYYNEMECILNTETRNSKPDLFIPEGEGFKVDYFDITCQPEESCPTGSAESSIRTMNSAIPIGEEGLHSLKIISDTEISCRDECYRMQPDKCRSFNYQDGSCELLYIGQETAPARELVGSDAYELMCVSGAERCSAVASYDRYVNIVNAARSTATLPGSVSLRDCLSACLNQGCQGVNYNKRTGDCQWYSTGSRDDRVEDPNEQIDYYSNNCVEKQVEDIREPVVRPPVINRPKIPKIDVAPSYPRQVTTVCNFDGIKVKVNSDGPFTGSVFAKNKYDTCRVEVKESSTAELKLGFAVPNKKLIAVVAPGGAVPKSRPDLSSLIGVPSQGIQGSVDFADNQVSLQGNPQGVVGAPDVPSQKAAAKSRKKRQTPGPFPTIAIGSPVRDCGVEDFKNGTYKATIVVQSNNLGVPGLVTNMDSIYEVSCDYTGVTGEYVEAVNNVNVEGPTAAFIQPRGRIELQSPVSMEMRSTVAGNLVSQGSPIIQARLGDMLELRWDMMIVDDQMDFFVRECIAERGGTPAEGTTSQSSAVNPFQGGLGQQTVVDRPGTLKLIERGCPTPAVAAKLMPEGIKREERNVKVAKLQAFRFDGSRTVRVICQLDICAGQCNPTTCGQNGVPGESFGRKKRDIEEENQVHDGRIMSKHYSVPTRQSAMTSLFIMDHPLQDIAVPVQNNNRDTLKMSPQQPELMEAPSLLKSALGKLCLPKSTFVGVFMFLGLLCVIQAGVVGFYATKRITRKK